MLRALALLAFAAVLLAASSFRLYLKEGGYHMVREYQVQDGRLRYYSTERGDWEEIPVELVDLNKTEGERQENEEARQQEAQLIKEEIRAEREAREEVLRVPNEPGVYFVRGKSIEPLTLAETKLASSKKRSILKALAPIPIVAGKSTLELDGERSQFTVDRDRPEFYFRLAREERFAMVLLTPKKGQKGVRVVQTWNKIPVSNELFEEHQAVDTFRHQVGEGVYKIWPKEPLAPGEYALIEYTEGKGNTQVWDFSWRGAAAR
jgi:hypothetical protein